MALTLLAGPANAVANVLLGMASSAFELGASRFVAGLAAGNMSAAYAYLTDISSEADRPKALGMLGAAFASASFSARR